MMSVVDNRKENYPGDPENLIIRLEKLLTKLICLLIQIGIISLLFERNPPETAKFLYDCFVSFVSVWCVGQLLIEGFIDFIELCGNISVFVSNGGGISDNKGKKLDSLSLEQPQPLMDLQKCEPLSDDKNQNEIELLEWTSSENED